MLAVGGLDPSGGAGLAVDVRATTRAGVFARCAATCVTVQNSSGVATVRPEDAASVRAQIVAAVGDGIDIVKTGLIPTDDGIRAVVASLPRSAPLVVDPVLRATSGRDLTEATVIAAYPDLLARATLATPNAAEAREISGEADVAHAAWAIRKMGAANVLVTCGDEPGDRVADLLLTEDGIELRLAADRVPVGRVRGTGCTLASLAAAHLAQGYGVREAAEAAVAETREALGAAFVQPGARGLLPAFTPLLADLRDEPREARARAAAVARAWRTLRSRLARSDVPEVGSNLSFLAEDGDPRTAAALSARCVRTGSGVALAGPVEIGGVHHTARVAAAAHAADPRVRAALNLRYRPEHVTRAAALAWTTASFRRADQPAGASSSVDWGTREAIRRAGGCVPDLIYDEGGPGKEPMVRILGWTPEAVAAKAVLLVEARS